VPFSDPTSKVLHYTKRVKRAKGIHESSSKKNARAKVKRMVVIVVVVVVVG
jgi:hypothetical protein